jgi:hypothetical protein
VTAWRVIRGVFNAIVSAANWVASKVTGAFHTIIGLPGKILGGLGHAAGSLLNTVSFGLLHAGGPVRARTHFDTGGPVGTDTVPGWLTPGEYVLNRATTARVGLPSLNMLNQGGQLGGNITIVPGTTFVQINGRTIAEAATQYTLTRAARGPSSLSGGAMMTGSRTA